MPFVYGYTGNKIQDGKVEHIVLDKLDFNKQLSEEELKAVDNNFLAWRAINVN